MQEVDFRLWLEEVMPQHARLTATVAALIENLIKRCGIEYLSVTSRTKELDSAHEKILRKEYDDPPRQITDLTGIRVITYLETQVAEIEKLIRASFSVDEANSMDRSSVLGDDRVGYRSTHFVCTLGHNRTSLPEYDEVSDLPFEIQVRTVLQHAWAELAHDRSFKFGAPLPKSIRRKIRVCTHIIS